MTIAAPFPQSPATLLVAVAVAAVVVLGVAFGLRGPGPATHLLPDMADRPVILPGGAALYVQRHEVTIAEWNLCFAQGACAMALRARPGHDPATTPATGLNYNDAQDYLRWINAATGHTFRLPTVDEWTHMARPVLPDAPDPLFTDPALNWASAYLIAGLPPRALRPQGSFSTTPEGIADLDGSVWEWTQDCYAGVAEEIDPARCSAYFVGGVHMSAMFYMEREPSRGGCAVGAPPAHLGMRLVSDRPVPA